MRRYWIWLSVLLSVPAWTAEPRVVGHGGLTANTAQVSPDQRFVLSAELRSQPKAATSSVDGRFALNAVLAAPDPLGTSCAPAADLIFRNGFESP